MVNIYSPTVQSIYGVPPGSMPTYVNIMNSPPAIQQEGFMPPPQIQQNTYNYGPSIGSPEFYQQQRNLAAQNLKQELQNPIINTGQGYTATYNPGYNPQYYNPYASFYQSQPSYKIEQGFNPLGVDEIPSIDIDERKAKLENFYTNAVEESREKYSQYNSYNYYGFMNNGVDPNITSQYQSAKRELEQEARNNRIELNKRISRAVHTYLGDYNEDYIDELYNDRKVQVNNIAYSPEWNEACRFARMVDITELRRQQVQKAHEEVTEKHNKIINPNSNIGEFFEDAGMLLWQNAYDKLEIQRRNRSRFSDEEFRDFLSTQIRRREPNSANSDAFEALMQSFPEVTEDFMNPPEGVDLLEDNTLKIELPAHMRHQEDEPYVGKTATFTVVKNNEIQNEFKERRQSFYSTIYN